MKIKKIFYLFESLDDCMMTQGLKQMKTCNLLIFQSYKKEIRIEI